MSTIVSTRAFGSDKYPYIMREADYQALRLVLSGKFIQIIAPCRVGKTSLLTQLEYSLKDELWRCCYLDLSTLESFLENETIWYTELGRKLSEEFTPGYTPDVN